MSPIAEKMKENLILIKDDFFHSLKHDLFWPSPRPTTEEQLRSRLKKQFGLTVLYQGEAAYLRGQMREQDRKVKEKEDLLGRKDKEIEVLRKDNWFLRWQLQEERNRFKHRR
jgi:hypothetical protein